MVTLSLEESLNQLVSDFQFDTDEKIEYAWMVNVYLERLLYNQRLLILTNKRILNSAAKKALGNLVEVSIEDDVLFYDDKVPMPRTLLKIENENKVLLVEILEPSSEVQTFVLQMLKAIQKKQEKERPIVVIDFSRVRDYLDKGGLVLTTVKCPQCGASIELPKKGSTTKCGYCRASIYAQDILEKFKGLMQS